MNPSDLLSLLPVIVLVSWASLLLIADLFIKDKSRTASLAAFGLAVTLAVTILIGGETRTGFGGMIIQDGFATFITVVLVVSGLVAIGLSLNYVRRMGIERGEYYIMLLYSISGMMLMSSAADLIVVFLALELFSIPLYVLSGIARPRAESEESAFKYFLIGAFSSAIMVFGIALVYGGTGTTQIHEIAAAVRMPVYNPALFAAGAGLVLVGLGFKVGAVPFHMWTPDVYQGAPSSVTAFMAVGAKAGGFAALLRIFVTAFSVGFAAVADLTTILWGLAAVTMIVGNVLAIAQPNIKRLLAYSSISHAGYILMAMVPYANAEVSGDTVASALFYILAFAVTSFGVWAVVISLEKAEDGPDGLHRGLELNDYAGLGRRAPMLAAAMTVFMLSFTGLPPTLGFAGKLFLFRTALEGGYIGLAVIGVLTSLISAYYYLRVVVIMYMQDGEPVVQRDRWLAWTAGGSAIATVLLSIFASPLFAWAAAAVLQ